MNYSDRYKVDEMNIKDLKPGIYNTFYYEDEERHFYFSNNELSKVYVSINDEEITVRVKYGYDYVYIHSFDKGGKLLTNYFPLVKYLDKGGELYAIKDNENKKIHRIREFDYKTILYEERRCIMTSSEIKCDIYYFHDYILNVFQLNQTRFEELVKCSDNIDLWNPKDFNLYIPEKMKYEFLHVYFVLKIFLISRKINIRDLRQYIFRFLFEL
jgi:hypothetical protein